MSGTSTPYASSLSSRSSSSSSIPAARTPPNLHQNSMDPDAKWLVQKFGGTSVGKFAVKIARDIVSEYLDQHKVAVVCSARSGSTKALGTTNLLLRAAGEALKHDPAGPSVPSTPASTFLLGHSSAAPSQQHSPPDSPGPKSLASSHSSFSARALGGGLPAFNVTVDLIRTEHVTAARSVVQNEDLLRELEVEIERDCEALRAFLFATQVIDEISPRSRDSIVGFGERLSCKIMTTVLRDQGVDAEYVSLENIVPLSTEVDGKPATVGGDAILDQDFYDRVSTAVADRIRQCGARVPVVTGFFGPIPGSLLRQVGRGYTDLLAALLAAALPASELQIWKEVDGIFTADPRKVPTARLIPIISPEEAAELTYYGSEVVHPFTMEQVIRKKIPIRIKNVENPQGGGTVIHPDPDIDAHLAADTLAEASLTSTIPIATLHHLTTERPKANPMDGSPRRARLPTAVTIKEHIVVLNVHSNRKSVSHGFLAGIFATLDRFGVVVDLISTSEVHVSMALEGGAVGFERLIHELRKIGSVTLHGDMAILSLVGTQMRNMVGIAGRMFSTLAKGNVNIEMISQGASEINISCVIDGRDAVKALNLIHQSCLQINPETAPGRMGPWLF